MTNRRSPRFTLSPSRYATLSTSPVTLARTSTELMDATLPLNSSDRRIGLDTTAATSTGAGEGCFLPVADSHPTRGIARVTAQAQKSRCLNGIRRAKKPDSTMWLAVTWPFPDETPMTTTAPCCFASDLFIPCPLRSVDTSSYASRYLYREKDASNYLQTLVSGSP